MGLGTPAWGRMLSIHPELWQAEHGGSEHGRKRSGDFTHSLEWDGPVRVLRQRFLVLGED